MADRLIIGALGRDAAKSNWILQLHDFIRKHQRLPNGMEVGRLKDEANIFDRKYVQYLNTDPSPGVTVKFALTVKFAAK